MSKSNNQKVWPSEKNPIVEVQWQLLSGFNEEGDPVYKSGKVTEADQLTVLSKEMATLQPNETLFTTVAMGRLDLILKDNQKLRIQPVFSQKTNLYQDLFYADHNQYNMPSEMKRLLNRWRIE